MKSLVAANSFYNDRQLAYYVRHLDSKHNREWSDDPPVWMVSRVMYSCSQLCNPAVVYRPSLELAHQRYFLYVCVNSD